MIDAKLTTDLIPRALLERVRQNYPGVLARSGAIVRQTMIDDLSVNRGGRPSRPGQAPGRKTGRLARSIYFEVHADGDRPGVFVGAVKRGRFYGDIHDQGKTISQTARFVKNFRPGQVGPIAIRGGEVIRARLRTQAQALRARRIARAIVDMKTRDLRPGVVGVSRAMVMERRTFPVNYPRRPFTVPARDRALPAVMDVMKTIVH